MKKIIYILGLVSLSACTDAERAKLGGFGDKFTVSIVNCDGSITHHWVTTGKVLSEKHSDGYYFNDINGDLIEVTGNLIIKPFKEENDTLIINYKK